jgi:hypothetical protein
MSMLVVVATALDGLAGLMVDGSSAAQEAFLPAINHPVRAIRRYAVFTALTLNSTSLTDAVRARLAPDDVEFLSVRPQTTADIDVPMPPMQQTTLPETKPNQGVVQ